MEKPTKRGSPGVQLKRMVHRGGNGASFVALLLIMAIAFSGCQRESSFEKGLLAKGSLQAALTGDCLPKTVNGIYKAGVALGSGNTVGVTVNVTAPGPYLISTNTINGYSFSAAGTFTATGAAVVVLQSKGKPTTVGTDTFTVRFDSSVCSLPVTVVSAATPPAVYTLVSGGTPPNCAGAVVNGNYTVSTSVDASHYVAVTVNVTTAGSYSLTATGGGLSFSSSGVFTATGVQTVQLRASGFPTSQGVIAVSFAPPFAPCSFEVNVGGPAVFTVNCAAAVVNGDYIDRTPLNSFNTITLPVVVTVPGTFQLTITVSGMTFSASGTLALGPQIITLAGTGAPNRWGTVNLAVGGSGCLVPLVVQAVPGSRVWRFTAGGILYEGPITSVAETFAGLNIYSFRLNGLSQSPVPGYAFSLALSKQYSSGTSPNVLGTYMSSWPLSQGQAALQLSTGTGGLLADSLSGSLTVIRPLRNEGTFSGTVIDSASASLPLINGYFRY